MIKNQTWIRCGWLIDGTGAHPHEKMLLGLENGAIASIEKASSASPDHRQTLDLSDCTLLPGLNDCHVHLFMSGDVSPATRENQQNLPFQEVQTKIKQRLAKTLSCGVVAVRDGGDRHAHTLRYRRDFHDFSALPIRVMAAGSAWHRAGRYGKFIGRPPVNGENLAAAIRRKDPSADHVKIVNSGINSLERFGRETAPQFGDQELKRAVLEAKKLGCKIMVHANGREPVRTAIQAGCHSVEHGFFMGQENLKMMAQQQTVWVPTAVTMQAYYRLLTSTVDNASGAVRRKGLEFSRSRAAADIARKTLDHQLEQIRMAKELGVKIALGTDAGSPGVHHGTSVGEEMRLLMNAGFSVAGAVRCATLNGASLLGLTDCGELTKGLAATFIAVPGPPQDLPESLRRITALFVDGVGWKCGVGVGPR